MFNRSAICSVHSGAPNGRPLRSEPRRDINSGSLCAAHTLALHRLRRSASVSPSSSHSGKGLSKGSSCPEAWQRKLDHRYSAGSVTAWREGGWRRCTAGPPAGARHPESLGSWPFPWFIRRKPRCMRPAPEGAATDQRGASPRAWVQFPGPPQRSARGFDIMGSRLINGLLGNERVCRALTGLDHGPTTRPGAMPRAGLFRPLRGEETVFRQPPHQHEPKCVSQSPKFGACGETG